MRHNIVSETFITAFSFNAINTSAHQPYCTSARVAAVTLALTTCLLPSATTADQHAISGAFHNENMSQFSNLIDSQFKKFSNSFSGNRKSNALIPADAEPEDSLKFDVNFEVTSAKIEKNSWLEDYSSSESPDTLYIPKFQFSTEISSNWNMGAFYSSVPDTNIQMYGGELRYSLFQSHHTLPALSVRGTYTELTGVENTFVTSKGLELAVSRGFNNVTPYAGFSTTWLDGEYQLAGYTETQLQNKYFLGMQFSLGMFTFAAETEQNGEYSSTNAKFGVRF